MNADFAVTGLILAGGRATRMGGSDKGLVELAGRPMVEYVLEGLRPQVRELLINANRNQSSYARYGVAVVADYLDGFLGPLAGFAAGMAAAETTHIQTAPCDSPFLPADLCSRMHTQLLAADAEIAVVHDGERLQPVFSLLPVSLLADLQAYLDGGDRKIDRWLYQHRVVEVDFSDHPETFLNVNTPEERAQLESRMARSG